MTTAADLAVLTRKQRTAVEAFAQALAVRDPDGTRLQREADPAALGREAAAQALDDARLWDEHLGGFYGTETVRQLLGGADGPVSRQAVSKRKSLLALRTGAGRVVYPKLQFVDGRPVDGLGEVLEHLPESLLSRWTVASWLASPNAELDGARPVDVLADGYAPAVVAAARRWAAALAA